MLGTARPARRGARRRSVLSSGPGAAEEAYVEAARRLVPAIAAAAPSIEAERRLGADLVRQLTDAGLFRMLVPASLGGGEAHPLTFARVLEEIAQADGSTAWCLGQGAGSAPVAASME